MQLTVNTSPAWSNSCDIKYALNLESMVSECMQSQICSKTPLILESGHCLTTPNKCILYQMIKMNVGGI